MLDKLTSDEPISGELTTNEPTPDEYEQDTQPTHSDSYSNLASQVSPQSACLFFFLYSTAAAIPTGITITIIITNAVKIPSPDCSSETCVLFCVLSGSLGTATSCNKT